LTYDDESHVYTQKLLFPIGEEKKFDELTFKPRLDIETIQNALQGVKSTDADGRILAYISALTGFSKSVIKKMDSEDYGVAQSIAIFFL